MRHDERLARWTLGRRWQRTRAARWSRWPPAAGRPGPASGSSAVQPAWRTLRTRPGGTGPPGRRSGRPCSARPPRRARCARAPPVATGAGGAALQAATDRLGAAGAPVACRASARCSTLDGGRGPALLHWLAEARRGARARPVEAAPDARRRRLQRHADGQPSGRRMTPRGTPSQCQRPAPLGAWPARCWGRLAGACWPSRRPPGWPAAVARATQRPLLLADARGTVWSGSAVAVLTGGAGSRDAGALPGRLQWSLGWADGASSCAPRQACCLRGEPRLRLRPGFGRLAGRAAGRRRHAAAARPQVGQWPAAWLAGLGTPWNTLQLDGDAAPEHRRPARRPRCRAAGASAGAQCSTCSRRGLAPVDPARAGQLPADARRRRRRAAHG